MSNTSFHGILKNIEKLPNGDLQVGVHDILYGLKWWEQINRFEDDKWFPDLRLLFTITGGFDDVVGRDWWVCLEGFRQGREGRRSRKFRLKISEVISIFIFRSCLLVCIIWLTIFVIYSTFCVSILTSPFTPIVFCLVYSSEPLELSRQTTLKKTFRDGFFFCFWCIDISLVCTT